MKTLQRSEVLSGVLFLLSAVAYVCFIDIPLAQSIATRREIQDWSYWSEWWHLFFLVMHISVPVCAYLHAYQKSYLALAVILIWCGLVFAVLTIQSLIGVAFEGYPSIAASMGIFGLATMVFAVVNTLRNLRQREMR